MPADRLEAFQPLIFRRGVEAGHVLGTQDVVADRVQIVTIGSVLRYHRGMDGIRRPIAISGRGTPFGLFGFWAQPSPTTGITASAARICEVSHEDLRALAVELPSLQAHFVDTSVKLTGHLAAWSAATRLRGGVVRQMAYSLLLLAESEGLDVITLPAHAILADLLGTTRESIARAVTVIEGAGAIVRGERKRYTVNKELLLTIARAS